MIPRHKSNPPDEVMLREIRVDRKVYIPIKSCSLSFMNDVAAIIKDEVGHNPCFQNKGRQRKLVDSRQLFAAMIKKYRNTTLEDIGIIIAKDHATVLTGIKTVNNLVETNPEYRIRYRRIDNKVKELVKLTY